MTGVRAESRDNHAGIQENVRKENSDNIEMIRDFILPVIIIPFFGKDTILFVVLMLYLVKEICF